MRKSTQFGRQAMMVLGTKNAARGGQAMTSIFQQSARIQDRQNFSTSGAIRGGSTEKSEFMAVFPELVDSLVNDPQTKDVNIHLSQHIRDCIENTVPDGKKNRGYSVPATYKILSANSATPEKVKQANILGWTVEFLQAFFLVADDIMDGSETRRGKPCWYLRKDIGLDGFNDSILLEAFVYSILKKYFRHETCYRELVDVMQEVVKYTAIGQALDLKSAKMFAMAGDSANRMNHFTLDRYMAIVKYKTSYYSFYLPVILAMRLAGVEQPELYEKSEAILLEMGEFFQIQDDYLDCFGDPAVTGKVGTDIQDGKCSWLAVKALQLVDKENKQELIARYGRKNSEDVKWVKTLYTALNLQRIYADFEQESYERIRGKIELLPNESLPHEVFHVFLNRIYKRKS